MHGGVELFGNMTKFELIQRRTAELGQVGLLLAALCVLWQL
jgi:hypothetical protein